MQSRTELADEPDAIGDGEIVEREVETVRTRQHVAGAAVDSIPVSEEVVSERRVGYFETLPERLSAVGFVVRASVEALLGIRFLLLASGANTSSDFAGFTLGVSWLFAWPFANVFSNRSLGPGVVEISTLVAMGVYFLLFALLGRLVAGLAPRLSGAVRQRPMMTLWPATPLSTPPAPAAAVERRRRPRFVAAKEHVRRHRRLFRLVRARES